VLYPELALHQLDPKWLEFWKHTDCHAHLLDFQLGKWRPYEYLRDYTISEHGGRK